MSQRVSGYERKERDLYETPAWVTQALLPYIPERIEAIYEPAAGSGKIVRVFADAGYHVDADDICSGRDFLKCPPLPVQAIVTNPPYVLAQEFITHALYLTQPKQGVVAMLLRTDYDHAAGRTYLFRKGPFACKVVLTKRIRWIEGSTGSPSFNHAWFIWDWRHKGPPTLAYH